MFMCAFNSQLLGLWHLYLQIKEKNVHDMNNDSCYWSVLNTIFLKLNSYHLSALPLSLWGGRILSGWFVSCSAVCIALLFWCLRSDSLNATTPSVSRCFIIRTAASVLKISKFRHCAAFFFKIKIQWEQKQDSLKRCISIWIRDLAKMFFWPWITAAYWSVFFLPKQSLVGSI